MNDIILFEHTSVPEIHLDCVAIVHDHFYTHNRMESESNTDQYNPIASYLMIDDMSALLDVVRGMYSKAKIRTQVK